MEHNHHNLPKKLNFSLCVTFMSLTAELFEDWSEDKSSFLIPKVKKINCELSSSQ